MLNIKNIISLSLFVVFLLSYSLKLIFLYKQNNIKANVLARGKKDKSIKKVESMVKLSTLIWGFSWFSFSLFEKHITNIIIVFFENSFLEYLGLTIIGSGLLTFLIAMVSMKSSWRVGIDKHTKSNLVTNGIYKYTRNPAFVGFDFMFLGLFVTYPNFLTLIIAILNLVFINLLILQEEKHLESAFGEQYILYKSKTPRYILFFL
jgi:protein-S-isoprenylcysteine O-methyltransferase Ste14